MDIAYMRRRINEYYDGKWIALYSMPRNQIIAIYFRMRSEGKFDKDKSTSGKQKNEVVERQLTIFEMPEYLNTIDRANVY